MSSLTRRRIAAALAGSVALPLLTSLPSSARGETGAGTVFTADEADGSISAIDLASGRVSSVRVPIGPHNVDATADGRSILAVGAVDGGHGSGRHGTPAGRVIVIEPVAGAAPRIVAEIPAGQHPAHVVADRAGRRAFVTDSGANALLVVDLAARRVVGSVATGSYPHGLRLSPDGGTAWIANVNDGSVSAIDLAAMRETARIPVGPSPVQVGFTPDGSRLFVSLRGVDAVAELDVRARRVVRRIAVGPGPVQVFATPDGRFLYVANEGTRAAPGTTVTAIEIASGRVAAEIETGRGPHGLAAADGSRVFVTNRFEDTVVEIAVAAQSVTRRFRVGRAPNGITWIAR